MNPYVSEIIGLFNGKDYDTTIKRGLKYISGPLSKMDKANICHYIGGACYNKMDLHGFIKWQMKAVEYAPADLWQHRLRCWGNAIFTMHHLADYTDEELAEAHFKSQEIVKDVPWLYDKKKMHKIATRKNTFPKRKLRIGYISGDFVSSVNLTFAIQLLGSFDKTKFEVYAYNMNLKKDLASEFVQGLVTKWCDISEMQPKEAATKICEDEIDILFDISLHCGSSNTLSVVAYKPAPIIVGGIGYMSTSGIKAVDYFLTDVYCDPVGMGDGNFSEKLLRLPHTHFCFTPREYSRNFSVNEEIHKNITFGSLNDFRKLNDEVLNVWKTIMDNLPDSRLILQSSGADYLKDIVHGKLEAQGFDMARIEIRSATNNYYATYNDIDIALDTYPYTGGATTFDALYMGVPVISRYGTRHGDRFGYSILQNLGLGELATDTWDKYIELAVNMANDRELLKELHINLRTMLKKSPLMDARLYVNSIENKYIEIWHKFLQENK